MAKVMHETLTQYKLRTGAKLAYKGRQPASYVPPKYRDKPADEQVMSGLGGVDEVKFKDGTIIWVCVDDEIVFETVDSAAAHRSAHGRARNKLLKQEEAAAQSEAEARETAEKVVTHVVDNIEAAWFEAHGLPVAPDRDWLVKEYMLLWDRLDAARRELNNCRSEYHKLARVAEENIELHKTLDQYAEASFPAHLRIKFIEMMAEAMENVGDKWMDVVVANREHNKKLSDIIES
jgi:hypothetical protein